jgi:hypothetical protein
MSRLGKATALILGLGFALLVSPMAVQAQRLKGSTNPANTSRPGVGILKSTDQGKTWMKKSGPNTITTCVGPGGKRVRC